MRIRDAWRCDIEVDMRPLSLRFRFRLADGGGHFKAGVKVSRQQLARREDIFSGTGAGGAGHGNNPGLLRRVGALPWGLRPIRSRHPHPAHTSGRRNRIEGSKSRGESNR